MPRAWTRPGDLLGADAIAGPAVDPDDLGLEETARGPEVEVAPATDRAVVDGPGPPPARTGVLGPPAPQRDDHPLWLEADARDARPADCQHLVECSTDAHVSFYARLLWSARNVRGARARHLFANKPRPGAGAELRVGRENARRMASRVRHDRPPGALDAILSRTNGPTGTRGVPQNWRRRSCTRGYGRWPPDCGTTATVRRPWTQRRRHFSIISFRRSWVYRAGPQRRVIDLLDRLPWGRRWRTKGRSFSPPVHQSSAGAVTTVTVLAMARTKQTPGQRLWVNLCRAGDYDQQAAAVQPPLTARRMDPQRATQSWLQGMSKQIKESFPEKFRQAREDAGLTQQQLSEIADVSVTGLAMIERGERTPGLDTAARICWALDVASGNV